ncbi:hypothetical protein SSX86_023948 [Deinandra increscens subsp. villosa]|uniref:Glycosyltransferase N-terminal domain-containing protein n=1 Tax=Deinandra increscens subsp. villosa TaxID=3103831 RepID=A0AAP0CIE2_9ASTR
MGSVAETKKPHAICIPFPAQGHINPMMKLAKLLHFRGFHISFVNNHYNHKRLQRSRGPSALDGLPDFRFYSISDGLPPSDAEVTQSMPALCQSLPKHSLEPFCELIATLNGSEEVPPVSCVISDGCMSFTLEAAERFGLPEVLFWTPSACGVLAYTHYRDLVQKEYIPLKDMSDMTNGYLETSLEWIPGMKNIRLKDFPSFIRTTDINDILLNYLITESGKIPRGLAIILNTFDALEQDSITPLLTINPKIFTIGPLHMMQQYLDHDERLKHIGSNLWKEDVSCIDWLDTKDPGTVVYVNFGSITVMTKEQLIEFGWGLANSKKDFLWITRSDIIGGDEAMMPTEFVEETKGRGMVTSWCPQEEHNGGEAISFFIYGFRDGTSISDLWRAAKDLGVVSDVFISRKKRFNKENFGFIRFKRVADLGAMERSLNQISVKGCRLKANLSKFPRDRLVSAERDLKTGVSRLASVVVKEGVSGVVPDGRVSFWDVLLGCTSPVVLEREPFSRPCKLKTVEVPEEEGDYAASFFGKALLVEAIDGASLCNLKSLRLEGGPSTFDVTYIGGLHALLIFNNKVEAVEFLGVKADPSHSSWLTKDSSGGSVVVLSESWRCIDELVVLSWKGMNYTACIKEDLAGWVSNFVEEESVPEPVNSSVASEDWGVGEAWEDEELFDTWQPEGGACLDGLGGGAVVEGE